MTETEKLKQTIACYESRIDRDEAELRELRSRLTANDSYGYGWHEGYKAGMDALYDALDREVDRAYRPLYEKWKENGNGNNGE